MSDTVVRWPEPVPAAAPQEVPFSERLLKLRDKALEAAEQDFYHPAERLLARAQALEVLSRIIREENQSGAAAPSVIQNYWEDKNLGPCAKCGKDIVDERPWFGSGSPADTRLFHDKCAREMIRSSAPPAH